MNSTLRFVAVALLSLDAVIYAVMVGLWPALGWLTAAIVAARYMPKERYYGA